MKSYSETGDGILMSEPNVEFLKDCVSQALKIDDKDSAFSRFKIQTFTLFVTLFTMHWLVLSKLIFFVFDLPFRFRILVIQLVF